MKRKVLGFYAVLFLFVLAIAFMHVKIFGFPTGWAVSDTNVSLKKGLTSMAVSNVEEGVSSWTIAFFILLVVFVLVVFFFIKNHNRSVEDIGGIKKEKRRFIPIDAE